MRILLIECLDVYLNIHGFPPPAQMEFKEGVKLEQRTDMAQSRSGIRSQCQLRQKKIATFIALL